MKQVKTMGMTKDDNMTLGTLLLGLGLVILLIWVLKAVLVVTLEVAESVLTVGFYAVLVYVAIALVLSIYAALFPDKTPKIIKGALAVNHALAVSVKFFFKAIWAIFRKKKSKT